VRIWSAVAVAVVVLVAGTVGSVLAANSVAAKSADESRAELAETSAQVASTLQLDTCTSRISSTTPPVSSR